MNKKTEKEKKEKAKEKMRERKENIRWLAKFLPAWVAVSIILLVAITAAYYYCEAFWVTIIIAVALGFLVTVIMLWIYDGTKINSVKRKR